jgi:hypothetical protein
MRPFSQKQPFARRDILIQGDSVRLAWGIEEKSEDSEGKPLRRAPPNHRAVPELTDDPLCLRLAEELDYARRMLDATGDRLSSDSIAVARHGLALQSLDIVGQMLTHIANVIRSSDPDTAVNEIGLGDLKARLTRSGAL